MGDDDDNNNNHKSHGGDENNNNNKSNNNNNKCDDDDVDADDDDDDKELFLSNHTQAMRRALSICQRINDNAGGFRPTTTAADDNDNDDDDDDDDTHCNVHSQRQEALQQLWKKLLRSSRGDDCSSSSSKNEDEEHQFLSPSSSSSSIIAELDIIIFPHHHYHHHHDSNNSYDDFVHNFQRSNQPCLIRGLDQTNFTGIMEQWGTRQKARTWFHATLGPDRLLPIRRRQQAASPNANALDPDGRAMECETLEMSLQEWICYLNKRNNSSSRHNDDNNNNNNNCKEQDAAAAAAAADLYLKDWHLEHWLENGSQEERKQHREDDNNQPNDASSSLSSSSSAPASATTANTDCGATNNTSNVNKPAQQQQQQQQRAAAAAAAASVLDDLYTLPDIFQQDLLNPFLHVTGTGGDYRFVYWGPAHSCTDWHSDVLHSFSWSFNVYGTKEWTFRLPPPPAIIKPDQDEEELETSNNQSNHDNRTSSSSNGDGDRCFVLRQSAGECIFVPATWKHQVLNLEETLSINRNWITTANLDLTWECLYTEIVAIHRELASWSTCGTCRNTITTMSCGRATTTTSGGTGCVDFDWEAHESMLRGCVGLDVTAFFFMILHRLLELLVLVVEQQQHTSDEQNHHHHVGFCWEKHRFDLLRLQRALCVLFQDELMVCLPKRLAATLVSPAMGREAIDMATWAIDAVKVYESQHGGSRASGNKTKHSLIRIDA